MVGMVFITALAFMFTHELDAITRHEWRIFPWLRDLPDQLGRNIFVTAHVPVFALLMWCVFAATDGTQWIFRVAFAAFCIVHVILHRLLATHPANEFDNPLSQTLIWGAGGFGCLYLVLAFATNTF